MTLKTSNKESIIKEINRKEVQQQLKKFYDKQVQEKKDKVNYEKQRASHEHLDLLNECRSMDSFEWDKIRNNKNELRSVVDTNTIQAETKKHTYTLNEVKQKIIEKAKIDAQFNLLGKIDIGVKNNQRSNLEQNAEEVKGQHLKSLKVKELEKKVKAAEEMNALQSNIEHLDKMERRYRNIFEVFERKHSQIQGNYSRLGMGKNNLARSEVDKDASIGSFVNKQIRDYEQKVKEENDRRRTRRMHLLNEMQFSNTNQIRDTISKKINQQLSQNIQEKLMIMKDIANQRLDQEDEIERKLLKEKYLKQNLDLQNTQVLIGKRKNFILNDKELGMNQSIIANMSKGQPGSKDEIQEDLIKKSYIKSFL